MLRRPTLSLSSRALTSCFRQHTLSSSRSRTAFPFKLPVNSRFASTSPAGTKSSSWSGRLLRLGLAGGAVYWYNTSPLFAEEQAYPNLAPDALRQDPNASVHTVESLTAERQKLKEMKEKEAALHAAPTSSIAAPDALPPVAGDATTPPPGSETPPSDPSALADEADQQGAFNPETGEINWDCPCLGGMAHGPCGENFRAAFSCFVYSKEEPKGVDCIDKFKSMQECFREHPDVYGAELEGDDEEEEGGDRIEGVEKEGDKPAAALPKEEHSQPSNDNTDGPVAPLKSPEATEKAK